MEELKLYAPTYYRGSPALKGCGKLEFDDPASQCSFTPPMGFGLYWVVTSQWTEMPPTFRSSRPNGWAIFLQPVAGGDPCGYVYFIDDGRSYLVPESDFGSTPPIRVLHCNETVPEIDSLQRIKAVYSQEEATWNFIHAIMDNARERGMAGPVAEYLVGANLALRFPSKNYSQQAI